MNVPIPTVVQRTVLGLAESVMNSIIKITTADLKVCGSYVIPRLTVKEETEQYFIIPVIWDFYVDQETHKIYKFYNGIDESLIPFDTQDSTALAFAG